MPKLKPCPFCGGEARLARNDYPHLMRKVRNGMFQVECNGCELLFGYDVDYGGQFMTEEEAIEAWNKRITITEEPKGIKKSCNTCRYSFCKSECQKCWDCGINFLSWQPKN